MGLHIYLKCNMMSLNLLQFLRPNSQISISARIFDGIRSNNDARKGLSFFVGHCRIRVRRCMLRGDDNISQGAVLAFLDVSLSDIFASIAWRNCHVFRNVMSFNECCEKDFAC